MYVERMRGERGQVLIIVAVLVPLILAIGAIVVDLGNFYEHRRHLQTQADAAALAGGGSWQVPCSQAVDDAIERRALQYSGNHNPDTHRTETGGYTPAPLTPLNAQVGTTAGNNVHITLNSTYWSSSSPPADYTTPAGSICSSRVLDVKATETNTGAFFGAIRPDLTAKARVEIRPALSLEGTLPFALESPSLLPCAWARFVNQATGALIGSELAMIHPTSGPENGDLSVWVLASPANIATPNPGQGVGLRVKFGSCTNTNQQDVVDLGSNKGITASQTYSPTWQADPTDPLRTPLLGPVTLTPTGPCTDAGFVSATTGPTTGTCTFSVLATANFHTGAGAAVRARLDTGAWTTLPSPSVNTWQGGNFTVTGSSAPGPHTLELQWARTSGTWCEGGTAPACTGGTIRTCSNPGNPWAGGNDCQGGWAGDEQYSFGARFDRSGSIIEAQILTSGLPATPIVANSTVALGARIRFKPLAAAVPGDPPIVLKDSVQESSNRSGAIDCGQGNNGSSTFDAAILNGCPDPYQINRRNLVCSPTLNPVDCVTGIPGNKKVDALDTRIGCTHNYWRDYATDPLAIKQGDPRVVPILITNLGALSRNAGNPQTPLPIVAVAHFYVVGWDGVGKGSCAQNDPTAPGDDDVRSMWGHFITYIAPPSGGTPGTGLCNFGSINGCIATLVE